MQDDIVNLILEFLAVLLVNFALGFYLITALQWYSYRFSRVLLHYAKPLWHIYYFCLPALAFVFIPIAFFIPLFALYLIFLFLWQKRLDKKLVFTKKVKVFFILLGIFSVLVFVLKMIILPHLKTYSVQVLSHLFLLTPLVLALVFLKIFSALEARFYIQKARKKLASMSELKIILITASFGKTSIKNFLFELLSPEFTCYKSPRSVNTLMGLVADINANLDARTQIYIAEAGARQKGDILEIARLLNPQICIIGEIGQAHLEHFKSEQNIRETKLEALRSARLEKAFLHSSTQILNNENYKNALENKQFIIYDESLKNVRSSLENLEFEVLLRGEWQEFKAQILGGFNAENLCASLLCADFLGVKTEALKQKVLALKPVEHRLQVISKEPKFIIDDGFNGNFKGMSESYRLCKRYKGRRVLVTPGIVEVSKEQNIALATLINECFDLAIITGSLNAELFKTHLSIEKIILENKADLVKVLAKHTKNGDLILFSNDAPNFM